MYGLHPQRFLDGPRLKRLFFAAFLVAGVFSTPASAAPPRDVPDPDAALDAALPVRLVMGVKFGGGGTLWDAPDGTVLGKDAQGADFTLPIFSETRAGYTMSAGFFVEGIFFDHLGLEVGFNWTQHTLFEQIAWTYTEQRFINGRSEITSFAADTDEELSWTGLHLPILVKAVVNAGKTRVSLGLGPEFEFTSWSQSRFKITRGGVSSNTPGDPNDTIFPKDSSGNPVFPQCYDGKLRLPGTRCAFERIGVKDENSVYLAVVFGIEIVAGDFLVPIDIHWSYNFSQPKRYLSRGDVDPNTIPSPSNPDVHPSGIDLKSRDSMYGGIRVGIAYQF